MDVSLSKKFELSKKGVGPYFLINLILDHSEVPAADQANKFAQQVIDTIYAKYTSIPGLIKTVLTAIYGKLTPEIKKNDRGQGVTVLTHVPAGGVGVPWSDVSPRAAAQSGSGGGARPDQRRIIRQN